MQRAADDRDAIGRRLHEMRAERTAVDAAKARGCHERVPGSLCAFGACPICRPAEFIKWLTEPELPCGLVDCDRPRVIVRHRPTDAWEPLREEWRAVIGLPKRGILTIDAEGRVLSMEPLPGAPTSPPSRVPP